MSRRWMAVASWSAITTSAVLAGSAAATWVRWSVRTGVAPVSAVVAVAVVAGVAVATRSMLLDASRGEDSRAAGRLVGFVVVTEVLAAPVGGWLLVGAVLVSALGLLLTVGWVTQRARHYLWRVPADAVSGSMAATSGAIATTPVAETTETTDSAGVTGAGRGASLRDCGGVER